LTKGATWSSVEVVCADPEDTVDSKTIREYLSLAMQELLRQLEEQANAA
jgi:hypothetical protein